MNRDFELQFASLVGSPAADHQKKCAEALAAGKSLILRAPTGSGKSEAVWIPFLFNRGNSLPMRMIHALPMRALANQLESRMRQYAGRFQETGRLRVAAMHGQRPESVLFYADTIFATLDQVVTSYACAPLSLGVRHGNIPAGAIPGSFLVFDEVHTFEPELGLQAVLVLARRAAETEMPFVIMSATLPIGFTSELAKQTGAEIVQVEEDQLPGLKQRKVTLRIQPGELSAEAIVERAQEATKTLVVVNTVGRALELYEVVRNRWECPILLAHSRFYDYDRKTKEQQIAALFGKTGPPGRCLLIATQVVEVGLDISCDILLTELAPIDSLIQRAGRCARWGGTGEVVVFTDLRTKKPYQTDFVDATGEALCNHGLDGQSLTWEIEKTLVDELCGPRFEKWIRPEAASKTLASLAEAAFTGNPGKAEKTVRDTVTIEVGLHDSPQSLGAGALSLPRCRIHPSVFQGFVREQQPEVWHVAVDRRSEDDYRPQITFDPFQPTSRLMPGGLYVINPRYACYDEEHGLRLGLSGRPATVHLPVKKQPPLGGELHQEPWPDHVAEVVASFERHVLPRERIALEALARLIEKSAEDLLSFVRLVLILHDLGKLTDKWQRSIQAGLQRPLQAGSFLAHLGGDGIKRLPQHATVSSWVASPCICRIAGTDHKDCLAAPALAAIAHHHSVRAASTPEFSMAEGWFPVVADCTRRLAGIEVSENDFNTTAPSGAGKCISAPGFLSPAPYAGYVLLSRWLRLADRIATGGGEDAVLRYEEWFGNL